MAPIGNAVFATLLTNDAYLPGAMVLGHSLRDRGSKGKLVVLVVVDKVAGSTISELKTVYDEIVPVQQIMNRAPANLYLMNRPDLISAFTKIQLWKQTQYDKIVYIDADVVALRAPNELLTMDTDFAAVPDIGWPDCFNSGVMVLKPNMADYYALLALAERGISFDGADQGLLNTHFTEWERLSFKYNCTPSGNYQYVPAYRHFSSTISLVHFIGREKPWNLGRGSRHGSGVYGELLARWWTVYDKHYRGRETVYYNEGQWQQAPKKVQDYVSGEETMYLPAYQAPPPVPHSTPTVQTPRVQPAPEGMPSAGGSEQQLGDQPTVEEQIRSRSFEPTSTVEQRRWSAPHADWEPAKAPPPANSKPEAANFPSQIYDFSQDTQLFQPPASYPEAPKDMWYEVPDKPAPQPKPKAIFPWETNAPRATRVFPEPIVPSPPPSFSSLPHSGTANEAAAAQESASRGESNTDRSIPHAAPASTTGDSGSADTGLRTEKDSISESFRAPWVSPWETFSQRSNAWDDMPEITKYVQALQPPKRGAIQVLHHTPSPSSGRRESFKITDFPTETERPSLPVTPAPIRRPTFWGDEKEMSGELPDADGVPEQVEWVRRFLSYPTPAFASFSHYINESNGLLSFICQHCGQQNPIIQLEELQRRQSEVMMGKEFDTVRDPPKRDLPGSASKEAVEAAVEKATSPTSTRPLKPILKEPKFEVSQSANSEDGPLTTDTSAGTVHDIVTEEILSPTATGENTSPTATSTSQVAA